MKGAFGLDIPTIGVMPHRHLLLLRCLGRFEFMFTSQVKALIFPDMSPTAARDALNVLLEDDLIWRTKARYSALPRTRQHGKRGPPMHRPYVYGLTHYGRTLLTTLEAEHDQRSIDGLRSRDPRSRPVPHLTLAHDLQVSWWCSSIVMACRQSALVQSVYVQVEFVVHERQRIDAVVIIRLTTTPRPRLNPDPIHIPFFDGTPRRPDELEIRLAFENDRGTEPLPVLLGKAAAYRDLTASGVYNHVFGGPVLPVFLVPTARRAGQLAREWRRMWRDGWGVVSTPPEADHPQQGALWGRYLSMEDGKPFPLLTALQQHGQTQRVVFQPLLTLEQWCQHNATVPTA